MVVVVGFATKGEPTLTIVPEQESAFQCHDEPDPRTPPDGVRLLESPLQMVTLEAEMPVGVVEFEYKGILILKHAVVLQVPIALTQYVVLTVGVLVIEVPVPVAPVPHEAEYQYQTAACPKTPLTSETDIVVPPGQIPVGDAVRFEGTVD